MTRAYDFWARVDKSGPCWTWTGPTRGSYGVAIHDGRRVGAHRVAYMLVVGPIPDGLTLDHLCRNTLCVNPEHLEPVTDVENVLRSECPPAVNARKTHCIHGHPLSGDNLIIIPSDPRRRRCRSCRAIVSRQNFARHKADKLAAQRARRQRAVQDRPPAAPRPLKTHCVNGHEFTEENTYWPPGRPGTRDCIACKRERERGSLAAAAQRRRRARRATSRAAA